MTHLDNTGRPDDSNSADNRLRFPIIDFLRGFALLNMIVYHILWDFVNIAPAHTLHLAGFMNSIVGILWQQAIGFTFLFIAGFCFSLGSQPVRKGIILILWSVAISAVTLFVIPKNPVIFGVLTLIGTGMLVLDYINARTVNFRTLIDIRPWHSESLKCGAWAVISLIGFALFYSIPKGYFLGLKLPQWLYPNIITAYVGLPPSNFISSDYYPVVPYIFVMIAGYFTYWSIHKNKKILKFLSQSPSFVGARFAQWMGRHSLIIYLLHQIVIFVPILLLATALFR
ncbi:heparan-alpha-glucosaminide N-acetyltransferase domain-containing protein [Alloscardovia omnicolens]|uniref:heparan-alpha-glucosaminide N-acetyltransferase domain-containing protein n=1 Tax=Alloscardovia omnicolens TaxID=419015 RepID=UPI003A6104D0